MCKIWVILSSIIIYKIRKKYLRIQKKKKKNKEKEKEEAKGKKKDKEKSLKIAAVWPIIKFFGLLHTNK